MKTSKRNIRLAISIVIVLTLLSTTASAQQLFAPYNQVGPPIPVEKTTKIDPSQRDLLYTPWKNLKLPRGTKLFIEKPLGGQQRRSLIFPGGVTIDDSGLYVDNSGLGAVQCAWEIDIDLRAEFANCSTNSDTDKRILKNLDHAIDRTNDFIVANSLEPTSKDRLQAYVAGKILESQDSFSTLSKDEREKRCTSGFVKDLKTQLLSDKALDQQLDHFLSIPRPPVLNPCL